MSQFDIAFERTVGHEGGYTADPKDRGNWTSGVIGTGELKGTKYGISAMSYPKVDIKNLTVEQAKVIYKTDFWSNRNLDNYPKALQFQLFDANVNHGWTNTAKMLQKALEVTQDGIVGPNTLAKLSAADEVEVAIKFLSARLTFLTAISTFNTYGKGWTNRVANNLLLLTQDF